VVTSVAGAGRASLTATEGQGGARVIRVGHSRDEDAYEAGRTAATGALDLSEPKLLLVFASFEYDTGRLLAGIAAAAGTVPVLGCTTAGEIGPLSGGGNGVVAIGFGGAFEVAVGSAEGVRESPRAVGEALARTLLPLPETRTRFTILLTDTLAGDQQELIRGVYGVLGATVRLVGGGAGDNLGMVASRQFVGERILSGAVVAVSIGTDGPVGLSVRHGWHRHGGAMVVTGSAGLTVHTLDDRPALDVYLERHLAPRGVEHDPAAFAIFAMTRPLAVTRRGSVAIRHVLSADPVNRSLHCAASLPRGATAWLAGGDVTSLLAAADAACADAITQLDGEPPLALLVFDCAARRGVLGDDGCAQERRMLAERAGDVPLAGFYTYGEIARTRGVNGYHNQTIVALALS
jgi:hypothetical protein